MQNLSTQSSVIPAGIPIVTICGFSNSGKTTLIEKLITHYNDSGLRIAVMKHYQRSFQLDTPGKDTYRFFEAGATVFGHDSGQRFIRRHSFEGDNVFLDILNLAEDHDLIIVEGHKHISLPQKIWLSRHANDKPPTEILPVLANLGMDDDRCSKALAIIQEEVTRQFELRPAHVGIFISSLHSESQNKSALSKPDLYTLIQSIQEAWRPLSFKIHLFGPSNSLFENPDYPTDSDCSYAATFFSATQNALNKYPHSQWLMINSNILQQKRRQIRDLINLARPGTWSVLPNKNADIDNPEIIWLDARIKQRLNVSNNFLDIFHHPKTRFLSHD